MIVGHYPYQMKGRLLHQITDAVLNQEAEHPAELLRSEPGNEMAASCVSRQAIAAARSCSIKALQSILKSSLSDILLTAVSKPKYRRYKDSGELASDLRIWLDGGKPKAASLKTKYFSRRPTEYTMSGLRAFLCHCSEDKSQVRELYANLRSYGLNIWFDGESLIAGQDWSEEIRRAVAEPHLVIVCLSSTR